MIRIERVLACLALAACAQPIVPAMHQLHGALPEAAPPGEARIVFVRPPSSCDTSDYPKIVDENGRFIANAGQNTSFVVTVPPGRHTFYAWPRDDLRMAKYPGYNPVAALQVDTVAGELSRVAILILKGPSLSCRPRAPAYELASYDASDAARAKFESWRRDATPMVADVEAGERDLWQRPDLVCDYLEAGRRRLPGAAPARCDASAPVAAKAPR
jgi:hypothetical protein